MPSKLWWRLSISIPGSAPPGNCCSGSCSSRHLRDAVSASRNQTANRRCKNFCKGEGKRRQSIAWRERAGRIIKRLSRSKFGLTGNAWRGARAARKKRSEEHTSELQSRLHLVCRLLLAKKKD